MFISYDIRNGVEYAKLCISKRNGKTVSKSYIYLGKVVDKEKFIFFNKDRGLFNYNPVDNSYTSLNSQSNIYAQDKTDKSINLEKKIDDNSKINSIEFQKAKFYNELPKLENSNNENINFIDNFEEGEADKENDFQDTLQEYDNRFEFLNNQHFQNQSKSPYQKVNSSNLQDTNLENYNSNFEQKLETKNFTSGQKENFFQSFEKDKPKREIKNFDIDNVLKNIISYGDVNFIQKIIIENQINDVVDLTNISNKKLLYVFIFHNILGNNSTDLQYWYDHSFVKYLYPNVNCSEESIFEDLENQEENFFNLYQQNVVKKLDTSTVNITNILGDTRLLTNHQGIPLCSLDAKTDLQDILDHLKKNEILTAQFIASMEDLEACNKNINLIANVDSKHELYDVILDSYSANNLEFVKFGEIFYQICKKQIQYEQYDLFTYTFCDIWKQSQKTIQTLSNFLGDMQNIKMTFDNVVVANRDFDSRNMLEIIKMNNPFDNFVFQSKNSVINFISSIIISATSKCLKINFYDAMMRLKNVKCFVDEKNNKHIVEDFDYSKIYSY
ncbi:MAG: hypothetical protein LBD32_02240 [Cytophagales bacterium]|jgi:hypothetical protein|nr:hypothetical protein [Cytophagales bacterium]